MAPYEPAIGDLVTFYIKNELESGEVCLLLGGATVAVRVTESGSEFEGQVVHFNAGNLTPVQLWRR